MAWTGVSRNRGTWKRVTRERRQRDAWEHCDEGQGKERQDEEEYK
jgi:hypothetical protein